MKGTRHQLAPIMVGQKIVDRAVACWVPDRLFIGCFQVVNVQELSGACRFGKLLEKSLLLFQRHIFSYSPAARLWLQRVDPTVVVGHMRSIFANLRLGFPIFPQQHHLDPLSNDRVALALQRLFQALYLVLVALDHPLPLANQSDGLSESHSEGYGEPLSGGGCWGPIPIQAGMEAV